ncbi:MAG: hypothetical protein U0234_01230 [Sandaracinus sp.]
MRASGVNVPTSLHEIPLALLDDRPELLLDLLARAGGPVLEADTIEPVQETFAQIEPATYAADRVYLLSRNAARIGALVVEMQRSVSAEKRWSWPLYLASAHARLRVPAWLVVLTLDRTVAEHARAPIDSFHGGVLAPFVIGPDALPTVPGAAGAELAVLSTMAHGRGAAGGVLAARALLAIREARHLDEARARLYNDLVLASIDELARIALEAEMKTEGWVWQSDFAKHWVGVGREEGREEGERRAVRLLCLAVGVPWTEERAAQVARATLDELDALVEALGRERRWPV